MDVGEKNIEIFAASAIKCTVHIDCESRTGGRCVCRRAIMLSRSVRRCEAAARCWTDRMDPSTRDRSLESAAMSRATGTHRGSITFTGSGRDLTKFARSTITNNRAARTQLHMQRYGHRHGRSLALSARWCARERIPAKRLVASCGSIPTAHRLARRMPMERMLVENIQSGTKHARRTARTRRDWRPSWVLLALRTPSLAQHTASTNGRLHHSDIMPMQSGCSSSNSELEELSSHTGVSTVLA